jgi:hypothetical protein
MDVLKVPHENLKEGHIVFKNLVTSNFMMRKEMSAGATAQQLVAEMAAHGSGTDAEEHERPEELEVPVARASPFRKSSNINFFVSDAR